MQTRQHTELGTCKEGEWGRKIWGYDYDGTEWPNRDSRKRLATFIINIFNKKLKLILNSY